MKMETSWHKFFKINPSSLFPHPPPQLLPNVQAHSLPTELHMNPMGTLNVRNIDNLKGGFQISWGFLCSCWDGTLYQTRPGSVDPPRMLLSQQQGSGCTPHVSSSEESWSDKHCMGVTTASPVAGFWAALEASSHAAEHLQSIPNTNDLP